MPSWFRTRRRIALALVGSVLVVGAAGVAVVYFVVFPTSSPKPFALTTVGTAALSSGVSSARLASGWKVAAGSEAGYRVREKLGFLPAESDAVGRTSAVSGSLALGQAKGAVTIVSASFLADLGSLKSDRAMRDQRIHTLGLQSDQYPHASFTLSQPATLPAGTLSDSIVHASVTGMLSIHGTARRVTIPIELRLTRSRLQAVGSLTFPWGEFNMVAPSVAGFVNVTNKATMEFDLHLVPA